MRWPEEFSHAGPLVIGGRVPRKPAIGNRGEQAGASGGAKGSVRASGLACSARDKNSSGERTARRTSTVKVASSPGVSRSEIVLV